MSTPHLLTGKRLLLAALFSFAVVSQSVRSGEMNLPYTAPLEVQSAQAAKKAGVKVLYGRVEETMDAGGYTYVLLDTGKEKVWAAGPITKVKVGDAVRVEADMPMKHLHSKVLKRDFDLVYFSGEIAVAGRVATGDEMNPHQGNTRHAKETDLAGIKKADKGMTIAEIYHNKLQLAGKHVRVRGKVSKYTTNVLKNNWLHIEDNSINKDLVVITQDTTQLGAVVVAEGVVSINKDIGIGPPFEVVLEKAKLKTK